jgi:hypothetical protein
MKFGIIDPATKSFNVIDVADVVRAYALAHLDPDKTDHGVVTRLENRHYVCYVVYEYGFFVPANEQHYCDVGGRLIAGRAVIYEADPYGRTVTLSDEAFVLVGTPTWFESPDEVELAIAAGLVVRPELSVNGEVLWSWPDPAPPEMAERMK